MPQRWQPLNRILTPNSITPGLDSGGGEGGRCFSRYGIQHLVGNVEETNSDVVFCDYTGNELRFGLAVEDPGAPEGTYAGNRGDYFSLEHPQLAHLDYIRISKDLVIKNSNGVEVKKLNGSGFRPYADIRPDSGYCSMVDIDITYRSNTLNTTHVFETYKYSFMGTLVKTLNEALIPAARQTPPFHQANFKIEDIEAVASYRDGGGYFLDFGYLHMAQSLKYKNSLGFPWLYPQPDQTFSDDVKPNLRANNIFFSSLMGITLNCGFLGSINNFESVCESHVPNLVENNTYNLPQTFFPTDPNSDSLPQPHVNNFHVGGSRIENIGVTEIYSKETFLERSLNYNVSYITAIKLKNDDLLNGSEPLELNYLNQNEWEIEFENSGNIAPETKVPVWETRWAIPQNWISGSKKGERLRFSSGGRVSSNPASGMNGRFSMNIQREFPTSDRGIRCAVKINEGN
jgi:hypothetical protein